jgi:hypothetical protein
MDEENVTKVFQLHIGQENFASAIKGNTLFEGVTTLQGLKSEKNNVFLNRKILKALLELNNSGAFNKSTIAAALAPLDSTGSMKAKHGIHWGTEHAWFILQCMTYIRKRSKEFSPRMEGCFQELILTMTISSLNFENKEDGDCMKANTIQVPPLIASSSTSLCSMATS